ncbi:voltage-gated clc-type chloride channel, putative [Perkinsus marinus ATCC 50983]|uniref:Voltage-gated clc-type chloride channel, putative n=1 Tax=Perkinsus marinus (strain ATCC 50983 / TXsc) TaxID=423536 RepID=C5LB80_PERM5|nr:voltage-gated clc-type chloride channel, putative [Perkinsus marinus ATCC 50983]EER06008.1 voltage-gated clc-type chloride channel, putative [Perkinsus marinus ATCC 50983]|eukprot:XP_002774192.1 voltage-gated clc-type chloride channel, putative [Perkinsus marinus ATCC 50983]
MASMATSIGVPAGLLTPSLVTGGYLGSAIGSAAKSIGEATDMSPSFVRYLHQTGVLFGMTGMFSSWFRTPITAVVIAYELTGVYSLVLPIMLCNYLSSALISLVYEKDVTEHMMERAGVSAEGAHFELTDAITEAKPVEHYDEDYHS